MLAGASDEAFSLVESVLVFRAGVAEAFGRSGTKNTGVQPDGEEDVCSCFLAVFHVYAINKKLFEFGDGHHALSFFVEALENLGCHQDIATFYSLEIFVYADSFILHIAQLLCL